MQVKGKTFTGKRMRMRCDTSKRHYRRHPMERYEKADRYPRSAFVLLSSLAFLLGLSAGLVM